MTERPTTAAAPGRSGVAGGLDKSAVALGLGITAVAILVGWALHATASVSALIAAAVFVAIAMAPLHRAVIDRTGRAWVGHAVTFLAMLAAILAFAGGLFFAAQRVASEFPALSQLPTPGEVIPGMGRPDADAGPGAPAAAEGATGRNDGAAATGGGAEGPAGLLGGAGGQVASRLADLASTVAIATLRYATTALGGLTLVIFLALIMLIDAPRWRARVGRVFGEGRARTVADGMDVTSRQLGRFVLVRAGIGVLTATLYMLWLWPFGVGLIFVWGVLTFLLTFIPNLGSIVSGLLPTIYAFLTKDVGTAIAVGAGLTVIEQVIGNYVDPRVQGRQVSVSPVVVYAALLLFAWIWGVAGALLSTPVLIAAVIAFSRVDRLRPAALLLSDARSYEELDAVVGR